MSDKIKMLNRLQLITVEEVNHRQEGARKIQGTTWLDGMNPLIVSEAMQDDKHIIFNGNRRFKYLIGCDVFPCIMVNASIASPADIQAGIEKYKGDSLSLSLADVVHFGLDKAKWQLGRYLAKDGETLFLQDMISFYEDYHPCSIASEGNAESDEGKAIIKKLKGFHKGLNQSVYRASLLGGQYAEDYINKVKGVSTALRAAFDVARKAQMRGLSWDDSKLEALPAYQEEIAKVADKAKDSGKADMDGIGNYISNFIVSINECDAILASVKTYHVELLRFITRNDVAGMTKYIANSGK